MTVGSWGAVAADQADAEGEVLGERPRRHDDGDPGGPVVDPVDACRGNASSVRALIKMNARVDIRDALPTVRVPPSCCTAPATTPIPEGRYLTDHIRGPG